MKFSMKQRLNVTAFGFAMLFATGVVAQPATGTTQKAVAPSFTGKYEGVVREGAVEEKLTLDLVEDAGKV